MIEPPIGLLLELSHRCPLRCGYCSNPLDLVQRSRELDTREWRNVINQAATLGILQVHFSGGEPTLRDDLEELVAHARDRELYTNLITSGVLLSRERVAALDRAGLDHVQLSFQDTIAEPANRIHVHHRQRVRVGARASPSLMMAVTQRPRSCAQAYRIPAMERRRLLRRISMTAVR